MQPQSAQDYKNLLTEVIKKQIVILGPDITLSKARNVKGLTVQDDGTVTDVTGSPQEVTQALIDQFVQLSGLIVKKTMEPLLLGTAAAPQAPAQPSTVIASRPFQEGSPLVGEAKQSNTQREIAASPLAPRNDALIPPPTPVENPLAQTSPVVPPPAQEQPLQTSPSNPTTPQTQATIPPATQPTDAAKNPQTA